MRNAGPEENIECEFRRIRWLFIGVKRAWEKISRRYMKERELIKGIEKRDLEWLCV